jgi:hypothetical protein
MKVHVYNLRFEDWRQENLELEASLGYIARSCLREKKKEKRREAKRREGNFPVLGQTVFSICSINDGE